MPDPTNAELMARIQLLASETKQLAKDTGDRDRAQSARSSEILEIVRRQGNQLSEFHARLTRVETDAEGARSSQVDLERKLIREIDAQNHQITAIKEETGKQSATLASQNTALAHLKDETGKQSVTLTALHKSDEKRTTREQTVFWILTKGIPLLWTATMAIAGAGWWLFTYVRSSK